MYEFVEDLNVVGGKCSNYDFFYGLNEDYLNNCMIHSMSKVISLSPAVGTFIKTQGKFNNLGAFICNFKHIT